MSDIKPPLALSASVVDILKQEASRKCPKETGGILLGSQMNGQLLITHATGPGPRARHGLASFTRDGSYAQHELCKAIERSDGRVDYLGEWHSHTLAVGPSWTDQKSMIEISTNTSYQLLDPLLLLVLPDRGACNRRNWKISIYRLVDGKLALQAWNQVADTI